MAVSILYLTCVAFKLSARAGNGGVWQLSAVTCMLYYYPLCVCGVIQRGHWLSQTVTFTSGGKRVT